MISLRAMGVYRSKPSRKTPTSRYRSLTNTVVPLPLPRDRVDAPSKRTFDVRMTLAYVSTEPVGRVMISSSPKAAIDARATESAIQNVYPVAENHQSSSPSPRGPYPTPPAQSPPLLLLHLCPIPFKPARSIPCPSSSTRRLIPSLLGSIHISIFPAPASKLLCRSSDRRWGKVGIRRVERSFVWVDLGKGVRGLGRASGVI